MKTKRRPRQREIAAPAPPLVAYRLMWLMVMFDLPVDTPLARKQATDFRLDLLDLGFERCQFSVYLRFCEGREQVDTFTRRVQAVLPPGGKVYCLYFTDKQYQTIVRFEDRRKQASPNLPEQYQLF